MDNIDDLVRTSDNAELSRKYGEQGSVFPDELVTAVGLFIPSERVAQFPRLHRLMANAEAASRRFEEVESSDGDEGDGEGIRNEEGEYAEDDDSGEGETIKDVGSRPPSRSAEETAAADASNSQVPNGSVAPSTAQGDPEQEVGVVWETWGGAWRQGEETERGLYYAGIFCEIGS